MSETLAALLSSLLAALQPMGRLSAEEDALAWLEDLASAHGH